MTTAALIAIGAPTAAADDAPFSLVGVTAADVLRTTRPDSSLLDVTVRVSDPGDYLGDGVDDGSASWQITAEPTAGGDAIDLSDDIERTQDTSDVDVWTIAYDTDDDALAGDYTLTVTAHATTGSSSSFSTTTSTSFGVRDATRTRLDVSPEPAKAGTRLALVGQVERIGVALGEHSWEPAGGEAVTVSFRPTTSKQWEVLTELVTDDQGAVSGSFDQGSVGGTWRLGLANTSNLAASSATDDVAVGTPTVCAGVSGCKIMKRIDVDGDGKVDEVGVVQHGASSIDVRVRTARKMLTMRSSIGSWAGDAFWGAAPIDGVKGAEIVLGSNQGAHLSNFRAFTVRKGVLVPEPGPDGYADWTVDGSYSSNMGYTRTSSGGSVRLVQAVATRHDSGKGHTGSRSTYRWTSSGWKFSSRTSSRHLSDKQAYAMGGWHIKGLRVFL